jgi:hypothetical protein
MIERFRQFKMQFKVIASVLLFFVASAQTMAAPNPQPAVAHVNGDIWCTLPFMILHQQ